MTGSRPLSIILPLLNEAQHIESCLQALQALRADGVEIIVVDGGSSDDSMRLALPLVDQVIATTRGRARQMNAGAAVATGDVLLFLHADTALPEQVLNLIGQSLAQSARVWGRFDVHISGRSSMLKVIAAMMNWRSRMTGIATGDQAIFVRRADFFAVDGFPQQPLMEDIELSSRLKQRSAPLCLSAKVTTSGRRWETRGVWRTILLMWSLRLRYWLGTSAEDIEKAYR